MYIIQIWILFLQLSFNCASLQDHLFYLLPATEDQLCPPGCPSAHTLSLPLHLSPGLKWPLGSTLSSPDHQKTTEFHSEKYLTDAPLPQAEGGEESSLLHSWQSMSALKNDWWALHPIPLCYPHQSTCVFSHPGTQITHWRKGTNPTERGSFKSNSISLRDTLTPLHNRSDREIAWNSLLQSNTFYPISCSS